MPPLKSLGLVLGVLLLMAHAACSDVMNTRRGLAPEPTGVLTVMTFNIRMGYGSKNPDLGPYEMRGRVEAVPEIVESIRAVDPDVIALQEVATRAQATRLAEALNLNLAHTPHSFGREGEWWGLAVLSKYPIVNARTVYLSRVGPPYSDRSLLVCQVELGGRTATFINVHRDYREENERSVQTLLQAAEAVPGPLVLLGDLNLSPADRRMEILMRRFVDPLDVLQTPNARNARRIGTWLFFPQRIDYVLFDPRHFEAVDAGLTPEFLWHASDHRGFYAKLVLKQ